MPSDSHFLWTPVSSHRPPQMAHLPASQLLDHPKRATAFSYHIHTVCVMSLRKHTGHISVFGDKGRWQLWLRKRERKKMTQRKQHEKFKLRDIVGRRDGLGGMIWLGGTKGLGGTIQKMINTNLQKRRHEPRAKWGVFLIDYLGMCRAHSHTVKWLIGRNWKAFRVNKNLAINCAKLLAESSLEHFTWEKGTCCRVLSQCELS